MKISFREWMQHMPGQTKLAIFDFDGTLANSPLKPDSQKEREAIGWDGRDWWGSQVSLPDGITFNDEVVRAFLEAKADPDTHAVLMTGRRGIISDRVRQLLANQGLIGRRQVAATNKKALKHLTKHEGEDDYSDLHDEFYSGDFITEPDYPRSGKRNKPDGSTIAHKKYIIEKKLMHEGIEQIDFWDDRSDHIPHFIKLGMDLQNKFPRLQRVTMHRVYPPQHPNGRAWVQHIPIRAK